MACLHTPAMSRRLCNGVNEGNNLVIVIVSRFVHMYNVSLFTVLLLLLLMS